MCVHNNHMSCFILAKCKESGFHKSSRLCLKAVRDAMLRHRWQEAAQFLSAYSQTLEETTVNKQSLACEVSHHFHHDHVEPVGHH